MLVHVLPGQGSQSRGMGRELFDSVARYRSVEKDVDSLLGYSLRQLCLEDPENRLKQTQYTQPALYVVNALYHFRAAERGEQPAFLAGHSLGEYNALLAAGVFDLLTGLRLVKRRGELMARARGGAMAAVLGLREGRIGEVIRSHGLQDLDIANYNSPTQTVISGPMAAIDRAGPLFEQAGATTYLPLQTSAAFHSRYVAEASREFAEFLASFTFAAPRIPVIANVTGRPYHAGDGSMVASLLVKQICAPVLWQQSMQYLIACGAATFKELGPGNVLTRLQQQIQREAAA